MNNKKYERTLHVTCNRDIYVFRDDENSIHLYAHDDEHAKRVARIEHNANDVEQMNLCKHELFVRANDTITIINNDFTCACEIVDMIYGGARVYDDTNELIEHAYCDNEFVDIDNKHMTRMYHETIH